MNKQRFLEIISEEDHIEPSDLESLKLMADQYPFSQVLHTLILKGATDLNRNESKAFLPKAAMYTTDRQVLRSILETPRIIKKGKKEPVKEPEISKAPVKAPEVSKTLDKQPETIHHVARQPISEAPEKQRSSEILRNELMASLKELMNNKKVFFERVERDNAVKSVAKAGSKITNVKPEAKTPARTAGKKTAKPVKKTVKSSTKPKKTTTTKSSKASKVSKTTKSPTPTPKSKKSEATKEPIKKPEKATAKKPVADHKPLAQKEQLKLINDFIKKQPTLTAGNEDRLRAETAKAMQDLSLKSVEFGEDLVSENLARILGEQGKTQKAIDIYKKLIWKFPQKKAYFASQIEKLNES